MLPLSKVTAATLTGGVLCVPKGEHALLGASSAEALFLCPGRGVMNRMDKSAAASSAYAAWGSAAHELAAMCLRHTPAAHPRGLVQHYGIYSVRVDEHDIEVSEEMIDCIQSYINAVAEIKGDDGVLWVEQSVSWACYTNGVEANEWGTADAIVILPDEVAVIDFKTGTGVAVHPEDNPQLYLYALGALAKLDAVLGQTPTWVTVGISQPRLGAPLMTHRLRTAELLQWAKDVAQKGFVTAELATDSYREGDEAWQAAYLKPGEKQCTFCKAKTYCPALKRQVLQTVREFSAVDVNEFDDVSTAAPVVVGPSAEKLAAAMRAVPLIEDFCKAIRDEVAARLADGQSVPGFKFVLGRQGNRVWSGTEADTFTALQAMGFKAENLWLKTLLSPAKIDSLAKGDKLIKAAWDAGQAALVTRSAASKTVVPETDPRPAVSATPVSEEFLDESKKGEIEKS
jgi:hypothetical protein